jgi:hypothetical protein
MKANNEKFWFGLVLWYWGLNPGPHSCKHKLHSQASKK